MNRSRTLVRRTLLAAAVAASSTLLGSSYVERHTAADGAVGEQGTDAPPSSARPVAFVRVNVVPMDEYRVLRDYTVVVRGGRIESVSSAVSARIPADARRIDGRGKYLMPGLAEMHAHVIGGQNPDADRLNRDIFFLYIANGITTIRAMLGAPNQLVLRDQLARGELLGPTMYVGAPSLNGQSAPDPATGERLVRQHKTAGYDFLKIHPGLSRATYDAVVRTARQVGLTWAGHVPQDVGVRAALTSRQSTIDHLDGYLAAAAPDNVARSQRGGIALSAEVLGSIRPAQLAELARLTAAAGVWNAPTMYLWENFFSPRGPEELAALPEMRYATPQWRNQWANQKRQRLAQDAESGITRELSERHLLLRRQMLKALRDAGARILMGTDSPQMFNVPGFSLHREIAVMRASGMTPYEILASGTRNVAAYAAEDLKLDGKFGTVAAGKRADLVLLDGNPLADLANLNRRAGVMVRGRWVPKAEIDQGLAELARRNAN